MYKHENRYTLFCYHLTFTKIKRVKTATILAYNLSNFPTQNVFWNQALCILLWVSQCRILEATCRKWCNHITVRQLISRDSNRRLVTGYTSQYIQFTLRKQPWHSDAAWEKKIKRENKKKKEVEEHHKVKGCCFIFTWYQRTALVKHHKMVNSI